MYFKKIHSDTYFSKLCKKKLKILILYENRKIIEFFYVILNNESIIFFIPITYKISIYLYFL